VRLLQQLVTITASAESIANGGQPLQGKEAWTVTDKSEKGDVVAAAPSTSPYLKEEREQRQEDFHGGISSRAATNIIATYGDPTTSVLRKEPKWPQQDDRIIQAILRGRKVGFDVHLDGVGDVGDPPDANHYTFQNTSYESPIRGLATVVSAYYDMNSKHPHHQYVNWVPLFLSSTDPLIFFCDPGQVLWSSNQTWCDFVAERRQHAPTVVVEIPFDELNTAVTFKDSFWFREAFVRDQKKKKRQKKGVDVYKIWNEKIIFLHEVSILNPFKTEHIFWVDAGYFRRPQIAPLGTPIIRSNITSNGVPTHQVLFHKVKNEPTHEIAAGVFGGTPTAIQNVYTKYWETFWHLVQSKFDCVGFEQRIFVWMCRSFPNVCNLHYHQDWFQMGRTWIRDPHRQWFTGTVIVPNDHQDGIIVPSTGVEIPSQKRSFS
jgi:hypothetical protein